MEWKQMMCQQMELSTKDMMDFMSLWLWLKRYTLMNKIIKSKMDDCDALGIISTTALLTPSGPFWFLK